MDDLTYPPEVPKVGALLRVTPTKVDYDVHNYRDFCEEAYVTSRFIATTYEGSTIIEVSLGGRMLTSPLRYNPQNKMWLISFDNQDIIVTVEIMPE